MIRTKYYAAIERAQLQDHGVSPLGAFDLDLLGTGGRVLAFLLRSRPVHGFLRTFCPVCKVGDLAIVTRYDDVRDVRTRHADFEAPYGREMKALVGGDANFLLGMPDSPEYRQQLAWVRTVFQPGDLDFIETRATDIASAVVAACGGELDLVEDLLTHTSARVCAEYYGLQVTHYNEFAHWLMSLSALLFADYLGDAKTRELALLGAEHLRRLIDDSISHLRTHPTAAQTRRPVLQRLLDMQVNDPANAPSDADIRALMMGLAVGFVPTGAGAGGHIMEEVLSRPGVLLDLQRFVRACDDPGIERGLMEALRFRPPIIPGLPRVATGDTWIGKKRIPAGTTILAASMSAMFDPRRVDEPGRFDVGRDARDIDLNFGGYDLLHYCVGEDIARRLLRGSLKPLLGTRQLRRAPGKAGRITHTGPFPSRLVARFEPDTGHYYQTFVSICVPAKAGLSLEEAERAVLALDNSPGSAFKRALTATDRVHFAHVSPLQAHPQDTGARAAASVNPAHVTHLFIELNVDGDAQSAVRAIAAVAQQPLAALLAATCGFAGRNADALAEFLLKHLLVLHAERPDPGQGKANGLNFHGTPGLSVTRIEAEAKIAAQARAHAETFLQQHLPQANLGTSLLASVRDALRSAGYGAALDRPASRQPSFANWTQPTQRQAFCSFLKQPGPVALLLTLGLLGLLTCSIWPPVLALVATVGTFTVLLRRSEKRATPQDYDPPLQHLDRLQQYENRPGYAQNHIVALTRLNTDPRWVRRLSLSLAFFGIKQLVLHYFRPGFVLDMGTIHYARWLRIPGTDSLLFMSNFDGSWESYLEDFITKAHEGQSAVWSNGVGFPATRFLIAGGAARGTQFKRWVRRQQLPTLFWYARYPQLTTDQIRNNALIVDGLVNARGESESRAWVDLLGSRPASGDNLETAEVQSLVLSGHRRFLFSEVIPVYFPEQGAQWQSWLAGFYESAGRRISFGRPRDADEQLVNIAFSAHGLQAMGLERLTHGNGEGPGNTLSSFPAAFLEGMHSEHRTRILGDCGDSDPSYWSWYQDERVPTLVLLVYATSKGKLTQAVNREIKLARKHGLEVDDSLRIAMDALPDDKDGKRNKKQTTDKEKDKAAVHLREPFGFRDGISQPVMRGLPRYYANKDGKDKLHVVEPGELLLGYPDNRGQYPQTPKVRADHDGAAQLPALPSYRLGRYPDFGEAQGADLLDLGRNGSFLVIRQLEQDVDGFKDYVQRVADDLNQRYTHLAIDADTVAAKMVGRWPDGRPLVRYPNAGTGVGDGGRDLAENDFLYGKEDPQGYHCPYSAHIRRANPRDSLHPDNPEQLSISNRHRILRRGRPYTAEQGGKQRRGLVFMCLNADIERQFEFIQQTWMNSPGFHGLENAPDPVAIPACPAAGQDAGSFTVASPDGPHVAKPLESFVTVRNGGYFFLPGKAALRFLATFRAP